MATMHDEVESPNCELEPALVCASCESDGAVALPTDISDCQDGWRISLRFAKIRRRRWWISGIVVMALIGIGLALGLSFGTGSPLTTTASQGTGPSAARVSPSVVLNRPEALAMTPNGDLLIANQGTNQIIRRAPNGTLTVIAGNGKVGYAGDGGLATNAEMNDPAGMAVATNGTIYVADTGNNRIRAISPSGTITTKAGNGNFGLTGVGGPATRVAVPQPVALAFDNRGQLYVADEVGIQRISPNGDIRTVVRAGAGVLSINGAPTAFSPTAVAVGKDGNLFVADLSPKLVVELTPTGQVVNSWPVYASAAGLAATPDGSILVANYGNFALDRIVGNHLNVLTSFRLGSVTGLVGTFRPSGVAATGTDQIYTDTDGANGGTDMPAIGSISTKGDFQVLPVGIGTNR